MWIFIQVAVLFTSIPVFLLPASLNWSEPIKLRETPGHINQSFASGSNGRAIVIWNESPYYTAGGDVFIRMLTPGHGWGPSTVISDGSGLIESVTVAMGADGTAIAAWRQSTDSQSQIVARKFV